MSAAVAIVVAGAVLAVLAIVGLLYLWADAVRDAEHAFRGWRRSAEMSAEKSREIADLRDQLAEATRNDHRGPDGRFVKAGAKP